MVKKLLLVLLGLILGIGITELVIRLILDPPNTWYLWERNCEYHLPVDPSITPGISGISVFSTNDMAIRHPELPSKEKINWLCIGGSTTECLYLDYPETWPSLLEDNLNTEGDEYWVGNAGKSSKTIYHHIVQLEHYQSNYPEIENYIVFAGINDLILFLARESEFGYDMDSFPGEDVFKETFLIHPINSETSFFKKSAIYWLFKKSKWPLFENSQLEDLMVHAGSSYVKWREHRQNPAAIIDSLPPYFQKGLDRYREALLYLADDAEDRNVQMLWITQPVIYKENLPDGLSKLCWMGGLGKYMAESGKAYYSIEALAEGMQAYNDVMRKVAYERDIPLVDLALYLTKDTTVFYDDVHFNESGARQVADLIYGSMQRQGLVD